MINTQYTYYLRIINNIQYNMMIYIIYYICIVYIVYCKMYSNIYQIKLVYIDVYVSYKL